MPLLLAGKITWVVWCGKNHFPPFPPVGYRMVTAKEVFDARREGR